MRIGVLMQQAAVVWGTRLSCPWSRPGHDFSHSVITVLVFPSLFLFPLFILDQRPRYGSHWSRACQLLFTIRLYSPSTQFHCQAEGFLRLVPGIVSGSCEFRKPFSLACREKSACARSCREGLPVPGVTSPIFLPWWRRTNCMASAMSLSLLTTTPQS